MAQPSVAAAFSTHPLKQAGAEPAAIADPMKREKRGTTAASLNIIFGNIEEWLWTREVLFSLDA